MTSLHGDAAVRGATVRARADAAEALCFARDLGGSLTHVVVAAAGRALAACAPRGADEPDQVGLVVAGSGRPVVVPVPGACCAPLPAVRDEVSAALAGGGSAAAARPTGGRVALGVVDGDVSRCPAPELLRLAPCVLEATASHDDPLTLALTLHVDREAADLGRAEELLARVRRLLERPYRRLV